MEGQRQRSGRGRKRRGKRKASQASEKAEPVVVAARRPDSPRLARIGNRNIAASAKPRRKNQDEKPVELCDTTGRAAADRHRRVAKIVQPNVVEMDDEEHRRQRLLERLLRSEGRIAISRAARDLSEEGLDVPKQQDYQLQLLEHMDEQKAQEAIAVLDGLLEHEVPIKRPILDQRLRRLEEEADDEQTRRMAAGLRRTIRA